MRWHPLAGREVGLERGAALVAVARLVASVAVRRAALVAPPELELGAVEVNGRPRVPRLRHDAHHDLVAAVDTTPAAAPAAATAATAATAAAATARRALPRPPVRRSVVSWLDQEHVGGEHRRTVVAILRPAQLDMPTVYGKGYG